MSTLRALLAIDGSSPDALLELAQRLLAEDVLWLPVYVLDPGPRHDLPLLRGGLPLSRAQNAMLDAASADSGRAIVDAVEGTLRRRGLAHEPGEIRTGEPGHALCAAAAERRADVLVLLASRQRRQTHGPASVGHTARFVLDHAPCPVPLLRWR